MQRACLLIATLASGLSAAVCFVGGLTSLVGSSPELGALLVFVLTPVMIAQAIVFSHVREQLGARDAEATDTRISDTAGTPWEKDSGHTS
jgi:hypothetical protein